MYDGVIVNKDYVLEGEDYYNVVLLNTGLETEKSEDNVQVQLDAQSFNIQSSGKANLISTAKHIVKALPNGGVVFVRDAVNDHVCSHLKKHNIMVARRVPESTLRSLSRVGNLLLHTLKR